MQIPAKLVTIMKIPFYVKRVNNLRQKQRQLFKYENKTNLASICQI